MVRKTLFIDTFATLLTYEGVCMSGRGRFVLNIGGSLTSEIDVKWEAGLKDGGGRILRLEVLTQMI